MNEQMPEVAVAKPSSPRWFIWVGGLAAIAVVAILAFVALTKFNFVPRGTAILQPGAIVRLLIPEAHAGDAFVLFAEKSDAAGIDADTSFIVKTKIDVTKEQIAQTLRMVPAVNVDVTQTANDAFKVTPKEPLKPGTVYRFSMATQTKKADGSLQTRDFAWALQTKNDLRVLSTIPGDKLSRIPVNTGIEFKFTYPNVEGMAQNFSITPQVSGRFEAHGRTVAFVPEKPLAYGTKYEVTLKKGVHVADSTLSLDEDAVMRFETEPAQTYNGNYAYKPTWTVEEFDEIAPGKEIFLSSYSYDDRLASSTIEVTGFQLTPDETIDLLNSRFTVPGWAPVQAAEYVDYKRLAKNQTFKLSVTPIRASQYGAYTLVLPKIDRAGAYAIKFLPKDGAETWMLLQATEHATYILGDKNTFQAWVVAASTQKVSGDILVKSGSVESRSDASGVAKLPSALLASTSTSASNGSKDFFIVDIGEGADVYHAVFWKSSFQPAWNFGYDGLALEKTWSYAFTDRPLYRGMDALNISGFAQDRESHRGVGDVTLKLAKQSYWYDWFGNEKIYQEQTVKTDDAGNYQATFDWNDMAAGYYQVTVLRDGRQIATRPFEIRDFVKPAFFINVAADQQLYYAGDQVTGSASVRFYDGTPLAKGKFLLSAGLSYKTPSANLELTTDENGVAKFSFPAPSVSCYPDMTQYCGSSEGVDISVHSAEGEEAEITGSASITAIASDLQTELNPATSGTSAVVNIKTLRTSLNEKIKPQPWGSRALKGLITVSHWQQIENGTYYDFYQKKTFPQYRYDRIVDPPITFDAVTDGSGNARYAFTMEKGREYKVNVEGADDKGRKMRAQTYLAIGWYDYRKPFFEDAYNYQQSLDTTPQLAFDPEDKTTFAENETVKLRYQLGKEPLDASKTPGVLFVAASRGLRKTELSSGPSWSFTFDKDLIPTAEVRAITFKDDHFQIVKRTVAIDITTRQLDVEAKPDQEKYAPGATVKVRVIAKDKKTGERVANTRVSLAAVDKSLEALTYFQDEDPLSALYGYVSDGITLESSSHNLKPANAQDFGAEKGGGGGDAAALSAQVRRNFKDTAAFATGDTDQNGEVVLTFKAPDNLTTWRTQLVGISPDVRAGAVKIEIPVTKSVFVDVVAPPRLLTKDKPVIKLRAFGVALHENDNVKYVVDAPTLGINNQTVDGKAFQSSYVAIDKLVPGRHSIILKVTTPQGTDALERIVTIVDTRFTQDVETVVEAIPGAALPDIGTVEEREIRFESKAQGSMLPRVRDLSYADWSPRVDAQIASRMMKKLLKDLYKDQYVTLPEDTLRDYLDNQGGIKLLPYASSDAELTAEVAATAPELFDQHAMQAYFYSMLEGRNASRELQVSALAGLAALHEPVLPMLQAMAAQTDLTWREQLVAARGLVAAGDREGASAILENLLKKSETRGTVMWLAVSDKVSEIYEATADAAALAASLGHAKAEPLMNYIDQNWSNEAFPLLAKARYLSTVAPMRPAGDVSLSYSTDGKTEKSVSLKEWPVDSVTLTAEEAKAFRVTKATGPIAISFVKRVAGRPTTKPEVNISRMFEAKTSLNDLREGDTVRIHLTVSWQAGAEDGCYSVRDHLPGGFQPVLGYSVDGAYIGTSYWYPYNVKDGEVSFYVCKDAKPQEFSYLSRIVSRGTYTAEAPVLQHLEHPSVSAIGADQEVTVK